MWGHAEVYGASLWLETDVFQLRKHNAHLKPLIFDKAHMFS